MLLNYLKYGLILILGVIVTTQINATQAPSIEGYSPVSYFTVNRAEKGNPKFSVTHKDKLYYLTSAEQVEIFKADPDKYRPRHNVCSYSLAYGKILPLDPTNFKIIANTTLLLFHRSKEFDGLKQWNNSGLTDQELLERANKKYLLFEF